MQAEGGRFESGMLHRIYMKHKTGRVYQPPPKQVCEFISDAYPRVGDRERLNQQDMASRIVALYKGPKCDVTRENVISAFPWMYQAGILKFESRWGKTGGYELVLWRSVDDGTVSDVLERRSTICNGMIVDAPAALPSFVEPVKVKRKRCCENRCIVRNKKTGRRRCKNCNTEMDTHGETKV